MKLVHTSHLLSVAQTKDNRRWLYRSPRFPNESKSIVHIRRSKFSYRIRFVLKRGSRLDELCSFRPDSFRCRPGRLDRIHYMKQFRRYNLLDDLTFMEKFDIIFCRNVLNFFDKEMQRSLLEKIYTRQAEGGFLYLGYNENISGLDEFYEPVTGMPCLYQARVMPAQVSAPVIQDEGDGVTDDNMPSFVRPVNLSYRRPVLSETLKK